jgi:hypothetical protein
MSRSGDSFWERAWQLDIPVGTPVEVTFEDGSLLMVVSEGFNGAAYHCRMILSGTSDLGSGCTVKPHQMRVLSALETFNLGVNGNASPHNRRT